MLCLIRSLFIAAFITSASFAQDLLWEKHGGSSAWLGYRVTRLRDINGDGVPDVAIGARNDNNGSSQGGAVYVCPGVDGAELLRITGGVGEQHGFSLGAAGDVNQDGVDDVISGAPGAADYAGEARVYSGKDGSLLFRLRGDPLVDPPFANAVSGAGDVDADGFPDQIVGANFGCGGRV